MPLLCLLICVADLLTGCASTIESKKVVFLDPQTSIVRIGPKVRGKVYFWNGTEWELSHTDVPIPEGWYAGHLPEEADPYKKDLSDKTPKPQNVR
jgi:hypothetical protein